MIETWKQISCDGESCGETEPYPEPFAKNADVRAWIAAYGWKSKGGKDYCPKCYSELTTAQRRSNSGEFH